MAINIGVNGYGRIGRILIRQLNNNSQFYVKAINSRSGVDECLLKYDSVFGVFLPDKIKTEGNRLYIGDQQIDVYQETDAAKIPWNSSIDAVIDCTGSFKTYNDLSKHLRGNIKKVILSCPPKDDKIPMYLPGINTHKYAGEPIISAASCTTNGLAPIIKVLADNYLLKSVHATTIHAVTPSDNLLDGSHKKEKRMGRAAMVSIRETSTGAAKAVTKIFPELKGKIFVNAYRVPVPDGSLLDITAMFETEVDIDDIKNIFRHYSAEDMKGLLATTLDPIVSCDCIGNTNSVIVDLNSIQKTAEKTIKMTAFYDNEWGYTARIVDLLSIIFKEK